MRNSATNKTVKLIGRYFALTMRDYLWAAALGLLLLFATLFYPSPIVLLAGAVLLLASLLHRQDGRLYQVSFDKAGHWAIMTLKHGNVWDKKMKRLFGTPFDEIVEVEIKVPDKKDPEKIGLAPLNKRKHGRSKGKTSKFGLLILFDSSSLSARDPDTQTSTLSHLGRMLSQYLNAGFSMVFQAKPENPHDLRSYIKNNIRHRVYRPESRKPEETQHEKRRRERNEFYNRAIGELVGTTQKPGLVEILGRKNTHAIPIVIAGNDVLGSRPTKIDLRRFRSSPVITTAHRMVRAAKSVGLVGVRIATPDELECYLRGTWDTVGLKQYNRLENKNDAARTHIPDSYVRTGDSHLEIDGNFIAIVRFTELVGKFNPNRYNRLYSLLDTNGRPMYLTISAPSVTVSAKRESGFLGMQIALSSTLVKMRYSGTNYRSPGTRKTIAEQRGRDHEIEQNDFRFQDFNVMCVVYGRSLAELEDNLNLVTHMADDYSLEPKIVKGYYAMRRALWASSGLSDM